MCIITALNPASSPRSDCSSVWVSLSSRATGTRAGGQPAADCAEELDATSVEPGLMSEEAAGADDRRRALCLRGLDDRLERPAVPRLEVPERVPVRASVREQRRQRGERHRALLSRKASASARVGSPAVQPSLVHAEAPTMLANSRQRGRAQPSSSP